MRYASHDEVALTSLLRQKEWVIEPPDDVIVCQAPEPDPHGRALICSLERAHKGDHIALCDGVEIVRWPQ